MDGVASLIRHPSGGPAYVEWDIFGPLELMTWAQKQEFAGRGTEIEEYRKSVQSQGIDLSRFDRDRDAEPLAGSGGRKRLAVGTDVGRSPDRQADQRQDNTHHERHQSNAERDDRSEQRGL